MLNFWWLANALKIKAWLELNREPKTETKGKICSIWTSMFRNNNPSIEEMSQLQEILELI